MDKLCAVSDRIQAHCDWLTATVPKEEAYGLTDQLLDAFGPCGIGANPGQDYIWQVGHGGGTVRIAPRGAVVCCGFSGKSIQAMRRRSVWSEVLWVLAERPHRVTRIDAAFDQPVDAPPRLRALFERGKMKGLRLSSRPAGLRLQGWKVGSDGEETGTVYIGKRTSEVFARVYDKRQEQLDNGEADPGPLLRYEVVVSDKFKVSLRDAWDPTPLFWHFASPTLLECPGDAPEWTPGGIGFDLPPRPPRTPYERLERYVEGSEPLRVSLRLADACGPHGRQALWWMMQKQVPTPAPEPGAPAPRGPAPPTAAEPAAVVSC